MRLLNNQKIYDAVKIYGKRVGATVFHIVNPYTVKSKKHEWEFKLVGMARRIEANPRERGQDYRNDSLYDYSYRDGNLRKPRR